jgi:ketol-acid reductoisomerase
VDCVTGPISRTVSNDGLPGLYRRFDAAGREVFAGAYASAYPVGLEITHEIYDEVASGNEIRSVILAGNRLTRFPMGRIDRADMWRAGEVARQDRDDDALPLNRSPPVSSAA